MLTAFAGTQARHPMALFYGCNSKREKSGASEVILRQWLWRDSIAPLNASTQAVMAEPTYEMVDVYIPTYRTAREGLKNVVYFGCSFSFHGIEWDWETR